MSATGAKRTFEPPLCPNGGVGRLPSRLLSLHLSRYVFADKRLSGRRPRVFRRAMEGVRSAPQPSTFRNAQLQPPFPFTCRSGHFSLAGGENLRAGPGLPKPSRTGFFPAVLVPSVLARGSSRPRLRLSKKPDRSGLPLRSSLTGSGARPPPETVRHRKGEWSPATAKRR
jgi:hypothetical protein